MASLKLLFSGVYASNDAIRILFLPLYYVLLLSPFLAVGVYYFDFGQTLRNLVTEDFSWVDILPPLALSSVFVLLPTRLLSTTGDAVKSKDGGKRRVQSLPYWIPVFRHFWSLVFGGDRWLKSVRDSSITNVVAYSAMGAKHNIILSDVLLDQAYKNWDSLSRADSMTWAMMRNAYSIPSSVKAKYVELRPAIEKTLATEIVEGKQMETLISATTTILSESLPDFITFNSSIVDQMQWERVSDVELTDGTSEVECNLFALVNEFCCNAILTPIMGTQFTESNQLLATDLITFNRRYWALAVGLPRLAPIQGLPGAALAQKRLLQKLTSLFRELTSPPIRRVPDDDESVSGEETDADIATPLAKLNELFTKHDLPMGARASIALQLIHSITSEVIPLVFWTLLHICSSSSLTSSEETPLTTIKAETASFARAIQPPSIHPSFPAPPAISFASSTHATSPTSFPYLRSCISEARRLYITSIATYQVTSPITLSESSVASTEEEHWDLNVGSYIDIGLSSSLINSSPSHFPSPETFKPDRFLNHPTPPSVSPPTSSFPSAPFKTTLLIALVAGITQLWHIAPAPKKSFFEKMQDARDEAGIGAAALSGEEKSARDSTAVGREGREKKKGTWVLPKAVDGSGVKVPQGDVRVRIRRVEGLPNGSVIGRVG